MDFRQDFATLTVKGYLLRHTTFFPKLFRGPILVEVESGITLQKFQMAAGLKWPMIKFDDQLDDQ